MGCCECSCVEISGLKYYGQVRSGWSNGYFMHLAYELPCVIFILCVCVCVCAGGCIYVWRERNIRKCVFLSFNTLLTFRIIISLFTTSKTLFLSCCCSAALYYKITVKHLRPIDFPHYLISQHDSRHQKMFRVTYKFAFLSLHCYGDS